MSTMDSDDLSMLSVLAMHKSTIKLLQYLLIIEQSKLGQRLLTSFFCLDVAVLLQRSERRLKLANDKDMCS